jgi:hypothetical protein
MASIHIHKARHLQRHTRIPRTHILTPLMRPPSQLLRTNGRRYPRRMRTRTRTHTHTRNILHIRNHTQNRNTNITRSTHSQTNINTNNPIHNSPRWFLLG